MLNLQNAFSIFTRIIPPSYHNWGMKVSPAEEEAELPQDPSGLCRMTATCAGHARTPRVDTQQLSGFPNRIFQKNGRCQNLVQGL